MATYKVGIIFLQSFPDIFSDKLMFFKDNPKAGLKLFITEVHYKANLCLMQLIPAINSNNLLLFAGSLSS